MKELMRLTRMLKTSEMVVPLLLKHLGEKYAGLDRALVLRHSSKINETYAGHKVKRLWELVVRPGDIIKFGHGIGESDIDTDNQVCIYETKLGMFLFSLTANRGVISLGEKKLYLQVEDALAAMIEVFYFNLTKRKYQNSEIKLVTGEVRCDKCTVICERCFIDLKQVRGYGFVCGPCRDELYDTGIIDDTMFE